MSTAVPAAAPATTNPSRNNHHRFRRPRRGGNRGTQVPQDGIDSTVIAQQTFPALVAAPVANEIQNPVAEPRRGTENHVGRRGRSGRGRRGGRQSQPVQHNVAITGRAFGGQLTEENEQASSTVSGSLQADAPEFRPGLPVAQRPNQPYHQRARRMSKSIAPDIATRIHEDISNGLYECAICTSEVHRNSKIWSCKTCWTVFHLSCIKRWSNNAGSTQQQQAPVEPGELPPQRQWRCPGCNLAKDVLPTTYMCWCEKEVDPKIVPSLPPHSCGQTCSKPRVPRKCPHPCTSQCHAGPCAPCSYMGPTLACFCGKEISTKRCIETDYENGWSCTQICGDLMPCGEHICERPCHEGLCGNCEVTVDSCCYCGKVTKSLPCSERGDVKESSLPGISHEEAAETWSGSFECGNICGRAFDCGNHVCKKPCHAQDVDIAHCPLSPDVVTHCPCGKTPLSSLKCIRSSCEDEIPHCQEKCNAPLRCGHKCQLTCHLGECMACVETITIKCRCGRTTSSSVCHQGSVESPQCPRICKAALNCGRHECGERCCPAEKLAAERQIAKRKQKPLNSTSLIRDDIEAEHICTRTCERTLKCGSHNCQELCHKGPCNTCREAIFDEISCHCGRTVLQPPLACGTQPPACRFDCHRRKPCRHPQVQHHCHMDDTECPKCPYLVEKVCMCGKSVRKNQPCWTTQTSCGQTCGRRLKCGHFCQKLCHRPGQCEDVNSGTCKQLCGRQKTAAGCSHPCSMPCHGLSPCNEDKPCQATVIITCECQTRKKEVKCMATKHGESNSQKKSLECDDECLRIQRNHKLAAALNISDDHLDDHIPYSTTTLDLFKNHVKWAQTQEREFRVFAADDTEKRLRFKPMPPQQREFIHSLAEDFGLDSESLDPEPHRHVSVFKTPRFVSAPMKTLAQCASIKPTAVATHASLKIDEPPRTYNALLLTSPRFDLTIDELHAELRSEFAAAPDVIISISFLPSEEIVLYQNPNSELRPSDNDIEAVFIKLKPVVTKIVLARSFASGVVLCLVDSSLNVLRREEDKLSTAGGWSQVVKGAPKKTTTGQPTASGKRNAFTVLGSRLAEKKDKKDKKDEKVDVIDDWEMVADGWD